MLQAGYHAFRYKYRIFLIPVVNAYFLNELVGPLKPTNQTACGKARIILKNFVDLGHPKTWTNSSLKNSASDLKTKEQGAEITRSCQYLHNKKTLYLLKKGKHLETLN